MLNVKCLIIYKKRGKYFLSGETYRRGKECISELDASVVFPNMLSNIIGFRVIKNYYLPNDHLPISMTVTLPGVDMECLERRVLLIGDHAVSYGQGIKQTNAEYSIKQLR